MPGYVPLLNGCRIEVENPERSRARVLAVRIWNGKPEPKLGWVCCFRPRINMHKKAAQINERPFFFYVVLFF